jgi:thymidylate synthase ThyX
MTEYFTPEEVDVLSPYVSNTEHPVFVVNNLPEEVVAVLFAYYSRSKESLRRNLLKLIKDQDVDLTGRMKVETDSSDRLALAREKARQFHEKWVVGYGHASVAEHAVAHIAIEDVSIVVSKLIEDNRLASFTEKSTRYVVFDQDKYYKAPELDSTPHAAVYHETIGHLMQTYAELTPAAIDKIKAMVPQREGQTAGAYNSACRAKACDVLRYILPAATFTNIGLTINGRALEHMITKLLSDPLAEARDFGQAIKREAEKVIPTLLKYADHNPYIADTETEIARLARSLTSTIAPEAEDENVVRLIRYEADADDRLAAAILYPHVDIRADQLNAFVGRMAIEEKERVIDEYLCRRGKWDEPLRALEHVYYTFEILVDYGAFRDIQRHRMATQTAQPLTDSHGYETPPEIIEFGYESRFGELMEKASGAFRQLAADHPIQAQYVLPLAYRKRSMFTWNLRSLNHFVTLRSARQGHSSYRDIAQQVFKEIERVHPLLSRYIRVDLGEYELARL